MVCLELVGCRFLGFCVVNLDIEEFRVYFGDVEVEECYREF